MCNCAGLYSHCNCAFTAIPDLVCIYVGVWINLHVWQPWKRLVRRHGKEWFCEGSFGTSGVRCGPDVLKPRLICHNVFWSLGPSLERPGKISALHKAVENFSLFSTSHCVHSTVSQLILVCQSNKRSSYISLLQSLFALQNERHWFVKHPGQARKEILQDKKFQFCLQVNLTWNHVRPSSFTKLGSGWRNRTCQLHVGKHRRSVHESRLQWHHSLCGRPAFSCAQSHPGRSLRILQVRLQDKNLIMPNRLERPWTGVFTPERGLVFKHFPVPNWIYMWDLF